MLSLKNKLKQALKTFKRTKIGSFIWNIYVLLQQKLFCYTHFQIIVTDVRRLHSLRLKDVSKFCGMDSSPDHNLEHLQAAMDWLCYAQDVNSDGGVATAYSFHRGWGASYPETTGYIIPTFFDYYDFTGQKEYKESAIKMANWLISKQLAIGAFPAGQVDKPSRPSVFNTGQIILGLVRAFKETRNDIYLKSAMKAGDWLVKVLDADGVWRKFAYNDIPHAYYTRVAWSLLELFQLADKQSYRDAAVKNLQWALSNQKENGWFKNNSFDTKANPFTHTIVYVAEGFLGAGILLNDSKYIDSADKVAKVLLKKFEIKKFLQGDFNERWNSHSNYSCLTGDAQLAILLMLLYEWGGDGRYLNAALKINQYVRSTQNLYSRNVGIRGGIKGSDPIWGAYQPYSYPNWTAKFFVDGLLLEERILRSLAKG